MSACLVAMVVLAFMGIFSARYRRWAKEAFGCVSRRVTLRPCNTEFNEKVKAKITSKLMSKNAGLARFMFKRFELLSWVFTVVLFISLAYTTYGVYNLAVYGTCDPITGNCVFNPGMDPNKVICPFDTIQVTGSVATIGNFMKTDTQITGTPLVYLIGTTWCPHCNWEKPIFQKVTSKFSGHVDVRSVELDISSTEEDILVLNHFSTKGSIPLVVIGGKYYRIGAGESMGEAEEEKVLTALLCDVTENAIEECNSLDISQLVSQI